MRRMTTFKERLISALSAKGMGAPELAEKTGYSRQAIYDWIKKDGVEPGVYKVLRAAHVLNVDAAWLAWGEDPKPKELIDEKIFIAVVKFIDVELAKVKASLPSDKRAMVYLLAYRLSKDRGGMLDATAISSLIDLGRQ